MSISGFQFHDINLYKLDRVWLVLGEFSSVGGRYLIDSALSFVRLV